MSPTFVIHITHPFCLYAQLYVVRSTLCRTLNSTLYARLCIRKPCQASFTIPSWSQHCQTKVYIPHYCQLVLVPHSLLLTLMVFFFIVILSPEPLLTCIKILYIATTKQ